MDGPQPEVTVVCITYKHEAFIAQALDSFLNQKTSFRFRVFVGEDKGPDGTADVIRDYAERFPDIIVPFIRTENMGAQRNLIDLCQRAGTKYIAFCEGDDYWTDEYKLQKQYDHMEAHPEQSGCFHNTRIEADEPWYLGSYYRPDRNGDRLIPYSIPRYDRSIRAMRMGYYLRFGPAHTSSYFFRWNYELEIPPWYYDTIFGDHPIMAMQIGDGLLGFLPDVMSVYRRHPGGIIMSDSIGSHHLRTRKDWLIVLEGLQAHFRQRYGKFAAGDIEARMVTEMRNYLHHAVRSGDRARIADIAQEHPQAFALMVDDYVSANKIRSMLGGRLYGSDIAGLHDRNLVRATSFIPARALAVRRRQRREQRSVDFTGLATRPKQRGLWLFMCDNHVSYRDNVRCFYEYLVANQPSVKPYWLTNSDAVLRLLKSEGLPVAKLKTARSRELLGRAEALFCQSLSDGIFEMRGFNQGLRIIRLLDNAYHASEEQLRPSRGLDIITDEVADQPPTDSLRRWSHHQNLIVTDSGRQVERLRKTCGEDGATVYLVPTEPRLLSIPEPLAPPARRHVLFEPGCSGMVDTEAMAASVVEHAEQFDRFAGERGFMLHIYGPGMGRQKALVQERLASLANVHYLETTDLSALLSRFAAAVTGLTPTAYSLFRLGVPVVLAHTARDDPGREKLDELDALLPGDVKGTWMEALTAVADVLDGDLPTLEGRAIREHFGLAEDVDADADAKLYEAVRSWLGEEVR